MSVSVHTIQTMLKKMRIPKTSVLLVHSAFKKFSKEGYYPEDVLGIFLDYMASGTLLLPTMSWRFVKSESPFFDELKTPSNTGILTELFRQRYATHRSLHPTHSVAGIGSQAEILLSTHHRCITPCGSQSPFAKLVEADAYIIMLGVGIDCCTLVHHVEELLAPNLYVKPESEIEEYQCLNRFGKLIHVKLRRHLFLPRNYWQFQDKLAENDQLTVFRCDNSICLAFRAKNLFKIVDNALKCNPAAIIAQPGQRYRMM